MPNVTISRMLSEYHNAVSTKLDAPNDESPAAMAYDNAHDDVVELLVNLGYEPDDRDELGLEISDDLQTLLVLAAVRSPRVAWLVGKLNANPEFFEGDE